MILDTPLDVKGPYKLRGTVDIYFQKGQWVARSWPKRPRHPNSPPQISVRKKFRAMLDLRDALPEPEQRIWKDALWPPDKSWDDAWRSSMLKYFHLWDTIIPPREFQTTPWYRTFLTFTDAPAGFEKGCLIAWLEGTSMKFVISQHPWIIKDPGVDVVCWGVNGMLCYAGRRMVPHYQPIIPPSPKARMWSKNFTIDGVRYQGMGTFGSEFIRWAFSGFSFIQRPNWDVPGYICVNPELRTCQPDIIETIPWE